MPILVDIHVHDHERAKFDVYIGRFTRYTPFQDSKWGNPFTPSTWGNKALLMYEHHARALMTNDPVNIVENIPGWASFTFQEQRSIRKAVTTHVDRWHVGAFNIDELTGKVLGCWCVNAFTWENPRCHGQILMKLWHEKHQPEDAKLESLAGKKHDQD